MESPRDQCRKEGCRGCPNCTSFVDSTVIFKKRKKKSKPKKLTFKQIESEFKKAEAKFDKANDKFHAQLTELQDNCKHKFERYSDYQETTYQCKKCKLWRI